MMICNYYFHPKLFSVFNFIPIANTGIESIKAALYPADTRFLYFVSKKDHTHQFSTNVKDHYRAVRKYQLRR